MDSNTHQVQLEKFTYGGEAMGRLADGRAVFVPFGLPGEAVRISLTQDKQNFARGRIVEIVQASADRIAPRCRHFQECGGCHYQNLPYPKQLQAKTEILRDQLQRIGKIDNPPVRPMVPSASEWNYRNHVQFHVNGEGRLGFMRAGSDSILQIEECHLTESAIEDFRKSMELEPGSDVDRVALRSGTDGDLMVILESVSMDAPEMEIEADISVVHLYEENPIVLAGSDHLFMKVLDREFRVSAPSFFQVNTGMAGRMVEHLAAKLPVNDSTVLLDVYCGAGLFSAFLARECKQVIGIESSASACEDFSHNLDEFDNVDLYEGTAEEVLPGLAGMSVQPSVVIVDPPRAGLEKTALDALVSLKPQVLAYVSCDPSTLARDAARLIQAGYRLEEVTPFDLFPQTYHIESISIFERH